MPQTPHLERHFTAGESVRDIVIGIALCCALGIVAGTLPATTAMQMRITDALRRT